MEKEDKIFEQFKSAAENAELKEFPAMDKVWSRVEDKLDNKKNKKAVLLWKKIAVAASLLLVTTLGYQFFKENTIEIKPNQNITATDSIKKENPNAVVTAEPINPAIKKDANQILQTQIGSVGNSSSVVMAEQDDTAFRADTLSKTMQAEYKSSSNNNAYWKEESKIESKKATAKDVEMFMNKSNQVLDTHTEEPLVVIDDKVEKKSIKEIEFNEVDSLVVLKEPLYIINGVEYTEQQVFGPNPTSPYTPLNKQEIETLYILQDEKAIEIYGNKGKKGVVIITTKNGKPLASKKAK